MQRALVLLAYGVICSGCASDDSYSPTTPGVIIVPPASLLTLIGTVEQVDGTIWLRESDTLLIRLAGSETAVLASVVGAVVEVTGTADAVDAFYVNEFAVREVAGLPAADGILEQTATGFALLRSDLSLRMLVDPPDELTAHVGERVWVAGPEGEPPVAFGVII